MIKRLLIAVAMLCAVTEAQVPVTPISQPRVTFVNASGGPCSGCTLSSFAAGTTTPLATYTDSTGVSQNTNPVVLDAAGGAFIWLGANSYKLILKDPLGATIWSVDHVNSAQLLPCATANAIQSANSAVNALTCDPTITINTTSHTVNIGTLGANHVIIGALGTPTLWTFDTTSPATALASLNPGGGGTTWANPLSFGTRSNGSTATVAASGTAGAITLSAVSDFVANQGVMIAHAGAACGSVKAGGCTAAPTPTVTTAGTAGSTTYAYQLACIDGLGGVGVAGTVGSVTTGNATLAGVTTGTVLSGNYNVVAWTGNSTCFEVAIYRNGTLVASEYSAPSGTMTYNDMGVAAWTNRDIPSTPPTTALNDNYVGKIQTLTGASATISPSLGVSITSATVYHSDTPMIQAAIASSPFVTLPPLSFLVNYPINYSKVPLAGFNMSGVIEGNGTLICDTGDICLDVTGDNQILLEGFSFQFGPTNLSSIGIYCSRDTSTVDLAQLVTTRDLTIALGGPAGIPHVLGGRGSVGIYNHACEIQHNFNDGFQVTRWTVITSSNVDHVSSLFSATDDRTMQSMSQVDFYSASGSGRVFGEFEDAFSINFIGGFGLGGFSADHPWGFEVDAGEVGRLSIDKFRIESKGGLLDVAAGAQLQEPYLDSDVYLGPTLLLGLPQVRLNGTASMLNADMVRADDYGGSGPHVSALVDGDAGCTVSTSILRLSIFRTIGTCLTTGVGNMVSGTVNYDNSLPVSYPMPAAAISTWVKLGTWTFSIGSGGSTLDIRFSVGAGFSPGNADKPALGDLFIRSGNDTTAPNISAATLHMAGQGQPALLAAKIVATGGSTSITNSSWDIYLQEAAFANGNYQIFKSFGDQWLVSNTLATDPGTGATIVPGTVFKDPLFTTATPSGTCTLNGFIPTVLNGTTVNVAICN